MESPADYYIKRNVKIIRCFNRHRKLLKVRDAMKETGKELGVTQHLVNKVIYDSKYSYAPEAHEIVNNNK